MPDFKKRFCVVDRKTKDVFPIPITPEQLGYIIKLQNDGVINKEGVKIIIQELFNTWRIDMQNNTQNNTHDL